MSQKSKYTIVIQWSDEDQCYVVFLPEFENVLQPVTHGETHEEALKNAHEVIELLLESAVAENKFPPKPITFDRKQSSVNVQTHQSAYTRGFN